MSARVVLKYRVKNQKLGVLKNTTVLYLLLSRDLVWPLFSADQEESFRMMDNLLVCVRHCSDLHKAKDPSAISVAYLHLFQYHILALALRYFNEDLQGSPMDGARSSGPKMPADKSATIGGMFAPTLQSTEQMPGTWNAWVEDYNLMT